MNKRFEAKDFSSLLGMKGFSDQMLKDHFGLYEGYVSHTNELLEKFEALSEDKALDAVEHAELRRRLGWEFNGIRLHELYFGNLGGDGELRGSAEMSDSINNAFGSTKKWAAEFRAVGAMRGVGWAILYFDPLTESLMNLWIDEHDGGHAAGAVPLVVMDVWEHAFTMDYGTDRDAYIESFMANLDWKEVENRLVVARGTAMAAR